jgi:hypothetical protein
LNLTDRKSKLLSSQQAYSRLYYDTRIKYVVAEAWPAERARILEQKGNGEDVKDPPEVAPLWFRNKIVNEEFLAETDDVKKKVEAYRQSPDDDSEHEGFKDDVDPEVAKQITIATSRAK